MKGSTTVLGVRPARRVGSQALLMAGRHQRRNLHFQSLCQNHEFIVRHTSKLRLDFGQACAAQFQAQDRAAGGKQFLRQSPLVPQFSNLRANNVLRTFSSFCHAPELELDNIEGRALNCSNIGATCRKDSGRTFHARRQAERQSWTNTS